MFGFGSVAKAVELPSEEMLFDPATIEITNPGEGEPVEGEIDFTANVTQNSDAVTSVDWTIYAGSCEGEGEIMLSTESEVYTTFSTTTGHFSAEIDTYGWEAGEYCFTVTTMGSETRATDSVTFVINERLYTVDGYKYIDADDNGELDYELDTPREGFTIVLTNAETGEKYYTETGDEGYFSVEVPEGYWTIDEEEARGWEKVRAYPGLFRYEIYEDESEEIQMTCQVYVGMESRSKGGNCVFLNREVSTSGGGTKVGVRQSSGGRVLGAATTTVASTTEPVADKIMAPQCDGMYLNTYMRMGGENDPAEVKKLQIFLNAIGIEVSVTGEFDAATDSAVRQFQVKYLNEVLSPWGLVVGTGYVYKTTRATINNIVCPGSEPAPEVQA